MVLAILDGWGFREDSRHNAIQSASTPVMDALWEAYPHTLIQASGGEVGLPDGQMGNSEVGHLTIGSGRIIRQELVRIGKAVRDGSLAANPSLNELADQLLREGGTLHLLGLGSDGGVHSHIGHLGGLLQWAASRGLSDVCIHVITDGRDTPPRTPFPTWNASKPRWRQPGSGGSAPSAAGTGPWIGTTAGIAPRRLTTF